MKFFKGNWYTILVTLIILLSIVLRFVNYQNRWGLAYDQAHDAVVARYALETLQLPLLGPFSSAGPYQTGGEWYWLIMAGTILNPFSIITPWIFITLLYVLFAYLLIRLGTELVSKEFGLIAGLLAAVSPAQITQGTNLTNQSPLAIIGLLAIWCSIRFLRFKKRKYLFLLALLVGLGASIHLQGAALGVLLITTFIVARKFDLKTLLCIPLGLLLPWLPVFVADTQNNFFNTRNMLQYYLHDQYKISLDVLGRNWRNYAGIFIPRVWSFVIGGTSVFGYATLAGLAAAFSYEVYKRKLSKEWVVLVISVMGMITILRYTRTPIFESYIVFMHAFILLITSWLVYWLYRQRKVFGFLILFILVIFSLQKDIEEIKNATNNTAKQVSKWKEYLVKSYPEKAFSIYDKDNTAKGQSLSLVLFLQPYNSSQEESMKVGLVATDSAYIKYPVIYGHEEGLKLVNLDKVPEQQLEKESWLRMDPELVYNSTELWYINK